MAVGDGKPGPIKKTDINLLASRLAKHTGIAEDQARELIRLIGTDWSSLVREAMFLKGRH